MAQQGDKWDRDLFENDLMGYAMCTQRYRLVVWKNRTKPESEPVFIELFDHQTDPYETKNIAGEDSDLLEELMGVFDEGWNGSLPDLE